MTERERLTAVFDGCTPDRTPWYGDLSWWHAAHLRDGTLPRAHADGGDGYLRMHRDAGVGIYLYAPMLWRQEYDETIACSDERDGDAVTTCIRTPAGTLRSVTIDLPASATSAIVEHFVKGRDDLAAVRHLWQHRFVWADTGPFEQTDAAWGDAGLPAVLAPIATTGLQMFLSRWAGVPTTVELIADARAEVEATFEAMQSADDAIFDILCSGPGRVVWFPENLSGEVTGRRLMRNFTMPYWERRIAQLHAAGKLVGIHNDGTLQASLPLLVEAGFDIVESVTPAPVGDMTFEQIRDAAGGRTIVWGGLPGALFSPLYSNEVFDAYVEQALDAFPRGSGFVLGVADQVPPDAHWSRICRVRDIVDRFG